MFGLSLTELLVILAIVLLLFGTRKLRNLGGDLGGAIKGFRQAMSGEDEKSASADSLPPAPEDDQAAPDAKGAETPTRNGA